MKRRRLSTTILALLLSLCMMQMCPVSVFADDGDGPKDNDYVKYYYDSSNKYRTGYKTIILDPYKFTDVTDNTKKVLDIAFLKSVVEDRLLGQWAPVADTLFSTGNKAANYVGNDDYKTHYRAENPSGGYFNVENQLSSTSGSSGGSWRGGDGWKSSAVGTATNLREVRYIMGQQVIDGMNAPSTATAEKLMDDSALGHRLKFLDVDPPKDEDGNEIPQQIFYKIATRVNRTGGTAINESWFQSFGIVFYDFAVHPLVDENIEYVIDDTKDPSNSDANNGSDHPAIGDPQQESSSVYAENNSRNENVVSLNYTNSTSHEISSSVEKSKEITFGQSIGSEFGIGPSAVPFPRWLLQIQLTFQEAYKSVYTNGESTKKESSQAINTEVTLPPQTAVEINQLREEKETLVDYNTPVAITYKVAVISIGGHNYTDLNDFYQGSRIQTEFCTVFGSDYAEGGAYAYENFYKRAKTNIAIENYDATYGKTYANFHDPGTQNSYEYNSIDWNGMDATHKAEVTTEITNVTENIPLCPCGTSMTVLSKGYTSTVKNIVPIYPLDTVAVAQGVSDEYEMTVGDKFYLEGIDLEGTNKNGVPFYGFDERGGHWVTCDAEGKVQQSSEYVSIIPYNSTTGKNVLTAEATGIQYLKWVLNSDTEYTSYTDPSKAVDGKFKTQIIKIIIKDIPFDGSLELTGDYTGYVGEPQKLLTENGLKAKVKDATGKVIDRPVAWEAQDLERDGITVDYSGLVTFSKPGRYNVRFFVRSSEGNVFSDWKEIEALPARKLDTITISDEQDPKVLSEFVLGDGSDQVDLSKLNFVAKDQYETNMILAPEDLKWVVNGSEINGNVLTVQEAGDYQIQLRSGEVTSNALSLTVKEKRALETLSIESDLTSTGLGLGDGYEYDLANITIMAKDQYGEDVDLSGKDLVWTCDNKYSRIENGKLIGELKGIGSLKLTVDGVDSNELSFNIFVKPYVKTFSASTDDIICDGDKISIDDLAVLAKDQEGNRYYMSADEISRIEWTLSEEGTIKSGVTYDPNTRTLQTEDGCVPDGGTGTVVLNGTFVNVNGKDASGVAELTIQQTPVLSELVISQTDEDEVIKEGEKVLCMEFFTVKAKDQYGNDFDLSTKDLTFEAANTSAFEIVNKADKNASTIEALAAGEESVITVSSENSKGEVITSNELTLAVPKVRVLASITFEKAPELVKMNSTVDASSFGAVCYDEDGEPFSNKDLAIYNKKVVYAIDPGETDAIIDKDGVIHTGSSFGAIKVMANVEDSDTLVTLQGDDGKTIEAMTEVWIGPKVENIEVKSSKLNAEGGNDQITLSGKGLLSGIEVIITDEDGNKVATAKTEGNYSKQSATVKLDRNTEGVEKVYKVSYAIAGITVEPDPEVTITVDFHKLALVPEKAASCTEEGLKEHYECEKCHTMFTDETGNTVLNAKDVIIPATGHKWDAGKVTKKAMRNTNGTIQYTCKNDSSHVKKVNIPVLLLKAEAGNKSVKYTWTKVKQADGYELYFSKCDTNDTEANCKLKKTLKGNSKLSFNVQKLKKGKAYKGYVIAYKMINGKKVTLAKSYLTHSICGDEGNGFTNPSRVKLKTNKITVKAGKTKKIKGVTVTGIKKKLKFLKHDPELRYATSNSKIAKVTSKGVIKGVKAGKCKIYVISENGIRNMIKVTVK